MAEIMTIVVFFILFLLVFFLINGSGNNDSDKNIPKIVILRKEDDSAKFIREIPRNPVLKYQQYASSGRDPATLGDPILPVLNSVGPARSAYDSVNMGPTPGRMLNIPVPQGSLKTTNEHYKYPFYYQQKPLAPYDFFKPYGPNASSMQNGLLYADDPFYTKDRPYLEFSNTGDVPFIGSVNSYAPFAEVQTPWEKSGILTKIGEEQILNIYRRPIAPVNDIFEYMVQDKDGFMIPLKNTFLENEDVVNYIPGKGGPWKVHIYVNNKYIWV